MVHILEIVVLVMIGGAMGWLTQAYVEEQRGDRLP
jgi:hypothetical protein